jgi:methyltransferase (TIGR00027 family)
MNRNFTLDVEQVSDTALITAAARAVETARPDAHFRDPLAHALAGDRGRGLLNRLPGSEFTVGSCVIRTYLLDELLMQTLADDHQIDTVVNLGAGLDARPFRLPLKPNLRWIEVDSQSVLDYKASRLEGRIAACHREAIPLDITDSSAVDALLHRIANESQHALVLTEGLLVYLTVEQVSALARGLRAHPSFTWWLTDLISPDAIDLMRRTHPQSNSTGGSGVPLLFAPEAGPEFFRPFGWEESACRSCFEESRRLDRWFLARSVWEAPLSCAQRHVLERLFLVVKLRRAAS